MKKLCLSTLLFLLYSCSIRVKPERVLDFREFKMTVPKTWSQVTFVGYDSYVGGLITDLGDTLEFDYGYWSNTLTEDNPTLMDSATYNSLELKPIAEPDLIILKTTRFVDPDVYRTTTFYYDSIGNYQAKFVRPNRRAVGLVGIYIDSVKTDSNGKIRFNFYGQHINRNQEEKIFRAFKTISFK